MSSTMARPTPTSAAATVMMNSAKICPPISGSCSQASNATRLMLTAFYAVEVGAASVRRLVQHDDEQQQHDDGADVEEDLHPRDELRRQHEERPGHAGQRDDEPEGGVHDVPRRDDEDGACQRHGAEE